MKGPRPRPVEDRFWEKVDRSGGPDAYWPWTGSRLRFGYGQFYFPKWRARGPARAHVVAWLVTYHGPVQPGAVFRHLCHQPSCCNPAHIYPGTQQENIGDMLAAGREARGVRNGQFGTTHNRGELNGQSKLTVADVLEIRAELADGTTCQAIANRRGLTRATISDIKVKKRWAWLQ